MRLAYFADPRCIHGAKWINHFAADHEVSVFCLQGIPESRLLSARVEVLPVIPRVFPLRWPPTRQRAAEALRGLLARRGVEVLHSMYAVPFAMWAHATGFPFHIATTRGSDLLVDYRRTFRSGGSPRRVTRNYLLRRALSHALVSARYVTSTSRAQQEVLWEMGCDPCRTLLVRTGVDVDAFLRLTEGRPAPLSSPGHFTILSPRVIQPQYNTVLVVEALAEMKRRRSDLSFSLYLVSHFAAADYLSLVERRIDELGLRDSVVLLPEQSQEELALRYRGADVVVMLPRSDGSPVSGFETMLAGRPLVLGGASYDRDVFSDEAVWRVRQETPEAVAAVILDALTGDPVVREAKVAAAAAGARRGASLSDSLSAVADLYAGRRPAVGARQCTSCVLDTNDDPTMTFDASGQCSHCRAHADFSRRHLIEAAQAPAALTEAIARIKRAAPRRSAYDSILGLSGGIDSSYACLVACRAGLRPLAVHLDNGWDSELAVHNIERLVDHLGLDLMTHVIDWAEFRDLQVAFLRASVVDIEMLTDHAIGALLLREAVRRGVRYVVSGWNVATEGILPRHWHHDKSDWLNIAAIHRRFGRGRIRSFPRASLAFRLYATRVKGVETFPILNFLTYDRARAQAELEKEVGWRDYGGKHRESLFTRFYQAEILPKKWGIDKRRAHYASLICSRQMDRGTALTELERGEAPEVLQRERSYVLKKLGLSDEEFEAIMRLPPKRHEDYPSYLTRHHRAIALVGRWRRGLMQWAVHGAAGRRERGA